MASPLDTDPGGEAALGAARALAAAGRIDEARAALHALRARLGVASPALELQLAEIEEARGDDPAALAALESALSIDPAIARAYERLAILHAKSGRLDLAREALQRGVAALPGEPALWLALARAQASLGDSEGALASAGRAEALSPPDAHAWAEIGRLHAAYWRWEDAHRTLDEASRRDPGAPAVETLRALAKQEMGDTAGALGALALAAARDPGDLRIAVAQSLMLPQVYADEADAARWRQRFSDGLARLVDGIERWMPRAGDVFRLDHQNFLLAYQGEDDRELQRRYSSFLARLAGAAHPEWRAPRRGRFDGARRLRIGFVSSIFRDCTAGRYFERWITGLDPRRFERFVYHTASIDDEFTRRIASSVEHFQPMRVDVEVLAARLAADALDAIVYPEVGMMASTSVLAALRLAPLQCAGWGHPVTTGSDAIDRYLTCAAMEPEDGADHYVERLVALPGIGVDYSMPTPPSPASRVDFRLPATGRVYMCPQSLFKVHPEMDRIFARILEADPEGVLVFFQATTRPVTLQFADRLQRALRAQGVQARGQVKFLPRMGGGGFRAALSVADVILDTVRWSGGNTSLDAFAAGTPVVTIPGRFMRGRQTAAMLRLMGIEALVATTIEDYVRIALDAARDRDRNAGLREAIRAGRGALFDRHEPVEALAEALLAAAAAA